MAHNRHFGLTIRGHFARVYIVNNTIFDNFCDEGILAFRGMEKESWIFANNIQVNDNTISSATIQGCQAIASGNKIANKTFLCPFEFFNSIW